MKKREREGEWKNERLQVLFQGWRCGDTHGTSKVDRCSTLESHPPQHDDVVLQEREEVSPDDYMPFYERYTWVKSLVFLSSQDGKMALNRHFQAP